MQPRTVISMLSYVDGLVFGINGGLRSHPTLTSLPPVSNSGSHACSPARPGAEADKHEAKPLAFQAGQLSCGAAVIGVFTKPACRDFGGVMAARIQWQNAFRAAQNRNPTVLRTSYAGSAPGAGLAEINDGLVCWFSRVDHLRIDIVALPRG